MTNDDNDEHVWVEKYSEEKKKKYWKNKITKKSTWVCPFKDNTETRSSSITPFSNEIKESLKSNSHGSKTCAEVEAEWVERYSSEKGKKYWKNVITKETTWHDPRDIPTSIDIPDGREAVSDWVEKYDKNKNKKYWKNYTTGETTWKDPNVNKKRNSSTDIINATSGKRNSNLLAACDEESDWVEKYDKKKDKKYWKNCLTGETTWKDPDVIYDHNTKSNKQHLNANEWVERYDKKKEKKYWKNYSTGETTWHDPSLSTTIAEDISEQWTEKYDKKKKKQYWKNMSSGKVTWKDPNATPTSVADRGTSNDEWVEKYDKVKKRLYWKNVNTKETTWKDPKSLNQNGNIGAAQQQKVHENDNSLNFSTQSDDNQWVKKFSTKKQKVYWKNVVTGDTSWSSPFSNRNEDNDNAGEEWIEYFDHSEGRKYWKNKNTFEIVFAYPDKKGTGFDVPRISIQKNYEENRTLAGNDDSEESIEELKDKYRMLKVKYDALQKKYNDLLDDFNGLQTNAQSENRVKSNENLDSNTVGGAATEMNNNHCKEEFEVTKPEENERPSSTRLSVKALSELGSSTKSLLKGDEDDDEIMDDRMVWKRQMAAGVRSSSVSNSRRSSSGIQSSYSTNRRSACADEDFNSSSLAKKPNLLINVYESGAGRANEITKLRFRDDESIDVIIKEVLLTLLIILCSK